MNVTLDKIANQINDLKSEEKDPQFVVLDILTWNELRTSREAKENIWYSYEQKDPYSPDKIRGVDVAIVTGSANRVIKVF